MESICDGRSSGMELKAIPADYGLLFSPPGKKGDPHRRHPGLYTQPPGNPG